MSMQLLPITARPHGAGGFSVRSLELEAVGGYASPIVAFDDFRVSGRPFGPHPHAGFSAVTYVFNDSPGAFRSRDSLGGDVVMGPGGIVWTESGRGVIHHELPAEAGREVHGVQVFVNLSAVNKLTAPRVLSLEGARVPEWQGGAGDRVRVVVGSYQNLSSPLVPIEPLDFFDVDLKSEVAFDLRADRNALVYATEGSALVRVVGREQIVRAGEALGVFAGEGRVNLEAARGARLLVLSGLMNREPVVAQGSFIMNDAAGIDAAIARYNAGEMGRLAPLPA